MRLPITVSLVTLLLLAGCSDVSTLENAELPKIEAEATPLDASPELTEPEQENSEREDAEDAQSAQLCSDELQTDIQESIKSQTEAFAAEDFQLAYSFSSPAFQENVNLQAFINVISSSYGPLLSSSQLQFSNCYAGQAETFGVIDVRFIEGGDALYALRYFMVLTDEGWRVEGAGDLELVASGS